MPSLFERIKARFAPPGPEAPDGSRDVLRSGRWAKQQVVPVDALPSALLLNETDRALAGCASEQVVLASMRAGSHVVELLLVAPDESAVALALRIPTAANQFKEPYVLLEAEAGNTREDAVREINFHVVGRVPAEDAERADWSGFLREAARKLEDLRALP